MNSTIDFGGGALGSLGKIASSPTREARRVCRRVESLRPIIGGMVDYPEFLMQRMWCFQIPESNLHPY